MSEYEYYIHIFQKLGEYLKYDLEECMTWMRTQNVYLHGCRPEMLILLGEGEKVLEYVETVIKNKTCGWCKERCSNEWCVSRKNDEQNG